VTWFPIGPDFVFAPHSWDYKRLSRRNETGEQGTVTHIAVDPLQPANLLVVDRPGSGGSALHLTRDGGLTWQSLLERLHHKAGPDFGSDVDPTCSAFHPAVAGTVYVATGSKKTLYAATSADFSDWSVLHVFPDPITCIVVDPRSTTLATTAIMVGTAKPDWPVPAEGGAWYSADGGTTWTQTKIGAVRAFSSHFPAAGAPDVYLSMFSGGLHHTSDPSSPAAWTRLDVGDPLTPGASGTLPTHTGDGLLVDYCRLAPQRVYVWAANGQKTKAFYRSNNGPAGPWLRIDSPTLPDPWQFLRTYVFAVAPNSPASGDGSTDVLFFGATFLHRSVDGGTTWAELPSQVHADLWSIVFTPGDPPTLLIGCDGGIGANPRYAAGAPAANPPAFNESWFVDPASDAFVGLNRGRSGSALYTVATDARIPHLNYIGCLDTGLARGGGSLTWHYVAGGDGGFAAAAPAATGVAVWRADGYVKDSWTRFVMTLGIDQGKLYLANEATVSRNGQAIGPTSNFVVDGDTCLAGITSVSGFRTLLTEVAGGEVVEATLDSVAGIEVGTVLTHADLLWDPVAVTAVNPATNTVTFKAGQPVPAGTAIWILEAAAARIDSAGTLTLISQNIGLSSQIAFALAVRPAGDGAACLTQRANPFGGYLEALWTKWPTAQHLWITASSVTAPSLWTEVANPPESGRMVSLTYDAAGDLYVILAHAVGGKGADGSPVTTPLYRIAGGQWIAEPSSGAPGDQFPFGRLIADPLAPATLYVANGGRVYRAMRSGTSWQWSDISGGESDGLPGTWVYDLWAGDIDPRPDHSKVVLRAAIATRGVYETDVTPGASEPPLLSLYLRDNPLDLGWLDESPHGVPDPQRPDQKVWWWQCADIKVDRKVLAKNAEFFATDPEWNPATEPEMPYALFDMMRDFSQVLVSKKPVRVHVAVRNRSRTPPKKPVWVWLLWTNAAAGVPRLGSRDDGQPDFDFWSLFTAAGINAAALPAASNWKPIGDVATIANVTADHPSVVTRDWTVPEIGPKIKDVGHFCLLALVHSADSPIQSSTGTVTDVDAITRFNRQIGQKNLHVTWTIDLPPPAPSVVKTSMTVEFHNPTQAPRTARLVFDLRTLPASVAVAIRLGPDVRPASMTGATPRHARDGCLSLLWRLLSGRRSEEVRYEAEPGAIVEAEGVVLAPGKPAAVHLDLTIPPDLAPGEHRFDVLQVVDGNVVGGSTYVVVVPGETRDGAEREEEERDLPEDLIRNAPFYIAPNWARPYVAERLGRPEFLRRAESTRGEER
jgi:hypothetical protein